MDEKTKIVFTGDIAFSKHMSGGWKNEGCLSQEVRNYLSAADHVVANMEGSVSSQREDSKGKFVHTTSKEAVHYLSGVNVLIWNLANNHVMDNNEEGLLDTLDCAKQLGCQTIGAGKNIEEAFRPIILGNQVRVSVFSFTHPWRDSLLAGVQKAGAASMSDTDQIKKHVQAIHSSVDWVVFVIHGGDEFSDLPMPYVREQYIKLLDLGADIIVGHHPHVVQNYERIGGKIIFYSLGNFIFDTDYQRQFAHTDTGILLKISFGKESFSFDALPMRLDRSLCRILPCTTPAVFQEINEDAYRQLWPFAARCYHQTRMKKNAVLKKKWTHSRLLRLIHTIASCRHSNNKTVQKGRFLACFLRPKPDKYGEIWTYLNE